MAIEIHGIKVQEDGVLIPWNVLIEAVLRPALPKRRFESSSSHSIAVKGVMKRKMSPHISDAFARLVRGILLLRKNPKDAEASEVFLEAREDLQKTRQGRRILKAIERE